MTAESECADCGRGLTPLAVFQTCASYLLAAGWYRDGDDLGIWSRWDTQMKVADAPFGDALALQLEADDVSLLEAVSLG